ncbi:developmental regulator [Niveomyces insectorum RCEF 264]|uniref:Developmental regulator n=1 Tax=Niveomyces insectorum RCEF 264 TaxID=1081102 RepID=A0A167R8M1_9HYPO|nr:developmental regulator [Niveomyces insectorum RCEF 264]
MAAGTCWGNVRRKHFRGRTFRTHFCRSLNEYGHLSFALPQSNVLSDTAGSTRDSINTSATNTPNHANNIDAVTAASTSAAASASASASATAPFPPSTVRVTAAAAAGYRNISAANSPSLIGHTPTSPTNKPSRSGTLLALAAAAIDRTQSAIAIAEQRIRPRHSAGRLSVGVDSLSPSSLERSPSDTASISASVSASASTPFSSLARSKGDVGPAPSNHPVTTTGSDQVPLLQHSVSASQLSRPPSHVYARPYSHADPNFPPPIHLPRIDNKMHQTSSRLLRMTDDDRPFTKDFKDLFSTLIVSLLPLSAHRVRLTKVEHTFLSEDAINNLGSLKFSQSNRMPDPKDPSRIVTTTTTTTFSMAKDMARSICQRFLEARFIESADGRYQQVYTMKGSVWQLTPKGISILDRFCSRNGIQQKQVAELIGHSTAQLVILERDSQSDKILNDRGTIEVIFRRFIGVNGLNVKTSINSADADSLSDYRDGLTGVKLASERKIQGKTYKDTFSGKAAVDWLMDCCTTVDRREASEIASLFAEYGLVEAVQHDRVFQSQVLGAHLFQPTKNAIFQLTAKGKDLINGAVSRGRSSGSDGGPVPRPGIARDSNTQRLDKILNDAALRLLFRENLRETHCEENLSFYLDVDDFVRNCRQSIRLAQKNPGATTMDGIKEIMAQAYGIYNAFLAPGSPCELNIDHQLRNNLATRMTKAVGQDGAMIDTLHEVTTLFEDAQNAVFKLMASDSVPKFLRHPKYEHTLRNYDFDAIVVGSNNRMPERSQSRSNRK